MFTFGFLAGTALIGLNALTYPSLLTIGMLVVYMVVCGYGCAVTEWS